jgi:hypothetical protein
MVKMKRHAIFALHDCVPNFATWLQLFQAWLTRAIQAQNFLSSMISDRYAKPQQWSKQLKEVHLLGLDISKKPALTQRNLNFLRCANVGEARRLFCASLCNVVLQWFSLKRILGQLSCDVEEVNYRRGLSESLVQVEQQWCFVQTTCSETLF